MKEVSAPLPTGYLKLAAGASVLVVLGFYVVGASHFDNAHWEDFGGFIGGSAGVALTALTFLALLYTIHIQSTQLSLSRQELSLTRDEMALNREELERSATALGDQVSAINIQNFERTLFDSLRFLNELVSQFEHRNPAEDLPRHGALAFSAMYHRLVGSSNLGSIASDDGDLVGSDPTIISFYDALGPMLGSYFRTLYNIYRYLDESRYSSREYYSRIIRSQISDHALVILFYNSLTDRGIKFQKYIVKYSILDNLNPGYLPNGTHAQILQNLPTPKALAHVNLNG